MKKKIILFLTFLMLVLCLTGCNQKKTVSGEKIDEMTQIANNVVNQKGYELPEGYKVYFTDNTTNARIKIVDNTNSPNEFLEIVFDISKEEIKLIEISTGTVLPSIIIWTILGTVAAMVIVYVILCVIKKILDAIIKGTRRKRRVRHEE